MTINTQGLRKSDIALLDKKIIQIRGLKNLVEKLKGKSVRSALNEKRIIELEAAIQQKKHDLAKLAETLKERNRLRLINRNAERATTVAQGEKKKKTVQARYLHVNPKPLQGGAPGLGKKS